MLILPASAVPGGGVLKDSVPEVVYTDVDVDVSAILGSCWGWGGLHKRHRGQTVRVGVRTNRRGSVRSGDVQSRITEPLRAVWNVVCHFCVR